VPDTSLHADGGCPGQHRDHPEANTDTGEPAVLSLTWFFTQTYRHVAPLDAVAAAAGRTAEELAADPATLLGVVGDRLADLLTGYQTTQRTVNVPEVEIIDAEYGAEPSLTALADTARAVVQAEANSGQRTAAGLALAALLAGLHREGITGE
jgi:hypothetical protein